MRYLLRIIPYLKPYKAKLTLAWICVMGAGAFVMVSPLLIRYAIDIGLDPQYKNENGKKGTWLSYTPTRC